LKGLLFGRWRQIPRVEIPKKIGRWNLTSFL
jgi:hypothetical protein